MKRLRLLILFLLLAGAGCVEAIKEPFSVPGNAPLLSGPTETMTSGELNVSAAAVVFDDQLVRVKSAAQMITVHNVGSEPVSIFSITDSGGEFTQSNNCPAGQLLPLGETCSIQVFFKPSADGERSGALQIIDSTAMSPWFITLSGRGVTGPAVTSVEILAPSEGSNRPGSSSDSVSSTTPATPVNNEGGSTSTTVEVVSPGAVPALTLSDSIINFAARAVGTVSSYRFILLTNSGTAPLAINLLRTTGEFGTINDCSSALGAGEYCRVGVKFRPSSSGEKNGELLIYTNLKDSPTSVALSGSGEGALYPTAEFSPAQFNFDTVEIDYVCNDSDTPPLGSECDGVQSTPLGKRSTQKEINLWNRGQADLVIEDISVSDQFELVDRCPTVLLPNRSCDLLITFVPSTGGQHQGELTILSNAPGDPVRAILLGTGGAESGVIEFEASTYTADESAGGAVVNINRTNGTDVEVEVTYTVSPGTARAGVDYQGTGKTITFGVGDYQKSTVIAIEPDLITEEDETIILQITDVSDGARFGSRTQAVVTIIDDD
jgi:hypothetical protein